MSLSEYEVGAAIQAGNVWSSLGDAFPFNLTV